MQPLIKLPLSIPFILFTVAISACTPASLPQEAIYFVSSAGEWRYQQQRCHSCTPENGFSTDGRVTEEGVAWQELWLTLKNDADETPPVEEVRAFFQQYYAWQPNSNRKAAVNYSVNYAAQVFPKAEDRLQIIVPVAIADAGDSERYFYRSGYLLATYTVKRHQPPVR